MFIILPAVPFKQIFATLLDAVPALEVWEEVLVLQEVRELEVWVYKGW
jgi:hypothetical protein